MFKSLKEKLSGWFKKVTGKEEKESVEEHLVVEEKPEEKKEIKKEVMNDEVKGKETKQNVAEGKKADEKKISEEKVSTPEETVLIKKKGKEIAVVEPIDAFPEAQLPEEVERVIEKAAPRAMDETIQQEEKEKRKGFFSSLKEKFARKVSEEEFTELFDSLEGIMLENNVALEIVDSLKKGLHDSLVGKDLKRSELEGKLKEVLRSSLEKVLVEPFDLFEKLRNKKGKEPFVILFFGINGSGKTTTIAKLAYLLKEHGVSCVLAAADTFRAASIEQLSIHGEKMGVKVIRHDYGSDPAAVAFDAIKYAKQHSLKAVLIDTAGRMHTKQNLMNEMQKINRVTKPDMKIFIGESITGNDAVDQARSFNEAVGIDGIILSKADVDEKGGAAISVGYVTRKPILYLGVGQGYEDLEPFQKENLLKSLGL